MGYILCDVMLLFVHHIVTRFSHSKAFFLFLWRLRANCVIESGSMLSQFIHADLNRWLNIAKGKVIEVYVFIDTERECNVSCYTYPRHDINAYLQQ